MNAAVKATREVPRFGHRHRLRIGLLGGSFNPAHEGHVLVARESLRRLGLDQVWLLVSPGNPLKPAAELAPFAERLASARARADGRRLLATDIERHLGTVHTVDTLRRLRRRFPRARFVFLMGADLLPDLPRWKAWRDLLRLVPLAIYPRPGYRRRARASLLAKTLRRGLRPSRLAPVLARLEPPAWVFLKGPTSPLSASALRAAERHAEERKMGKKGPAQKDPSRGARVSGSSLATKGGLPSPELRPVAALRRRALPLAAALP